MIEKLIISDFISKQISKVVFSYCVVVIVRESIEISREVCIDKH